MTEHPCHWVAGTEECDAAAHLAELEARLARTEVWVNPATLTVETADERYPHVVTMPHARTTLAKLLEALDWRPPRKSARAALG